MWYTKEPAPPSWFKTPEQLIEEQKQDKVRNEFAELIRNKRIKKTYKNIFIMPEIAEDLKDGSSILDRCLELASGKTKGPRGFRDIRVKAKINKNEDFFTVEVENIEGEPIEEVKRFRIDTKLYPKAKDVEIEIKWVILDKEGKMTAVADYSSSISKLMKKLTERIDFKWKN